MRPGKYRFWAIALFLATTVVCLLYFFLLKEFTIQAYQGNAPEWFNNLIRFFYPRFETEKYRLPLEFFINKSQQVVLRFSLVSFITSAALLLAENSDSFKRSVSGFFNSSTSIQNVNVLRILFFTYLLIISAGFYEDLMEYHTAKVFYKPIWMLKLFHLSFPDPSLILAIWILLLISIVLVILNIYPIIFSCLSLLSLIYVEALFFSFEKVDHHFATFTYAIMLFPFLLQERKKARQDSVNAWPLQLIMLIICVAYLMSGLEKLLISDFQWISSKTFRTYLQLHPTPWGLKVSRSDFLCMWLPAAALLFQLGFISILFLKKYRGLILILGILFHFGTLLLLNIGGYLNPWIFTYIFFIDWSWRKEKITAF